MGRGQSESVEETGIAINGDNSVILGEEMESEFDQQEQRILAILGMKEEDDFYVSEENQEHINPISKLILS